MNRAKRWISSHQATAFFVLAYGVSWTIWLPTILGKSGGELSIPITLAGGFGPWVAAMIVLRICEGRGGLGTWLRRNFRFRLHIVWYLGAIALLPFAMAGLHHGIYLLLGGRSAFTLHQVWAAYPVMVLSTALIGGGNEEPGWRGFATPALIARYHPVVASCIIGVLWAGWHMPLYLSSGWSHNDQSFAWFVAYAMGLSVVMTWLYYRSGSVVPVMLLHAATNAVFTYFPTETVVFQSMGYDFNVIKTITYWLFAMAVILLTNGRLGALTAALQKSVSRERTPSRTAEQPGIS